VSQFLQTIVAAFRPSELHRDVPALDEARVIESLPKCGQHRPVGHRRSGAEVSDDRHRLLRARRERPRSRATE